MGKIEKRAQRNQNNEKKEEFELRFLFLSKIWPATKGDNINAKQTQEKEYDKTKKKYP